MRLKRRKFLYLAIGSACVPALARGTFFGRTMPTKAADSPAADAAVSGPAAEATLAEVRETHRALGAPVSITALHADAEHARRAIRAAFAELDRIEDLMSLYRPHSQLSRLNRDGRLSDPHADLLAVLRAAQEVSRRTDGAFDVTVQPLWDLYAAEQQAGRVPSPDAIATAGRSVDWRRLHVSDDAVRLQPGMAVTLNGIAQGFAADCVAAVLREQGIDRALIDAGEISALGPRPGESAWTVGVQHPREPDAYISLAKLAGRCLSTSGDYATSFTADFSTHHVFDPRSGRSPTELASVTVAAPNATLADALATALFVMGRERGEQMLSNYRDVDILTVGKDGRVQCTAGFPRAGGES